jgi:DnaJ family protein C protein 7
MPSLFTRKKSSTSTATTTPDHQIEIKSPKGHPSVDTPSPSRSAQSSPEKKSRSSFVRERGEKEKKPRSPRGSSSFAFRRRSSDSHPLNLPPEELRRLSALRTANMGSPREETTEPMQESTPAPQQAPGAFPQANGNGVNSEQSGESGPAPPPHRSASSSPAQSPAVDAEQCKEAGNKFFKAKQYDKAIEEYTKGSSSEPARRMINYHVELMIR